MSLPLPFGINYRYLEDSLAGIAMGDNTKVSHDYATFLTELELVEKLANPTESSRYSRGSILFPSGPITMLDILAAGVQIWAETSNKSRRAQMQHRLTADGFLAFYERFVWGDLESFKAIMGHKLLRHRVVQDILRPLGGRQSISYDGFQAHLRFCFKDDTLFSYKVDELLELFERYGLVILKRDSFRITSLDLPSFSVVDDLQDQITGWTRVQRNLFKAATLLSQANHPEEFQEIGLLCREALISLGQAVYNPQLHASPDDVKPSSTDAKRMLEAFIATEYKGDQNITIRKLVRSAIELAVALQHDRKADRRKAALCLETTSTIARIISILYDTALPSGQESGPKSPNYSTIPSQKSHHQGISPTSPPSAIVRPRSPVPEWLK